MKATKTWHCSCCNEIICPGEEFKIENGDILKLDHSMIGLDRKPHEAEREANSDFLKSHVVFCRVTEPKKIKTEQLELVPVRHDYSKHKREIPEQKDLQDLPLFNLEYQRTEQLSLF